MKFSWNRVLNFHAYAIFPPVGIFLIYAIGAAILKGQWMLLLAAIIATCVCTGLLVVLAIMSE